MMKAGKWWCGDLCYVMHDKWDEVCAITIKNKECLDGEFELKNGTKFALYHTAYGDGLYQDKDGREYGVDAGLIGCILLDDIDVSNSDNNIYLGHVIDFDKDFTTNEIGGIIRIGHIVINTNW